MVARIAIAMSNAVMASGPAEGRDLLMDTILESFESHSLNWLPRFAISDAPRSPEFLSALLRDVAIAMGGEAWRARIGKDDILCVYSVYDRAVELSGRKIITMRPIDRHFLQLAKSQLCVSPPY